jgi:pimeloyl-ACP methyl ester carboxylesterase
MNALSYHKAYTVIYFFHGHSYRYALGKYDDGKDTVPKIAAFVAANPVIVVAVDGYVVRDYQGFYGGTPYDVMKTGGDYDFGPYFRELVTYIDSTYRTLTSRRFRATSGLSMGGFMSLYLNARYPELIGSASSFNPGLEFYVGDKSQRVLWRPKDHVSNHTHTMVRLIRASGDYISQYTEKTHDAYARADNVDFEFRQDEYHRHWTTSIGETFEFHLRAFAQSNLDNVPVTWNHCERGSRWPRAKSLRKLKDTVRAKTQRTNGHSLQAIIVDLNRTLKGWFEYFKHSHKPTSPRIDQWVRMRLRSILRRRHHKRGQGRGCDHRCWPNAFFAEHELFSLVAAHVRISLSSWR